MEAFVGIDVSKGYADFIILNGSKQVLEPSFQLDDTRQGHEQLKVLLQQQLTKWQLDNIYCGLESTGGYENNWYRALADLANELPLQVTRINPKGVKAQTEALLKRTITDAVSAHSIALYLINHPEKLQFSTKEGDQVALRKGFNLIKMLNKQKTQLSNQLEKLLYQVFPELLTYCKDGFPCWLLHLLVKYPSAYHVSKATVDALDELPYVSPAKAEDLWSKASRSVAAHKESTLTLIVRTTAQEILHKQQLIEELKQQLCLKEEPQIQLLCSIKGISTYTATGLVMEIEDVNRFPSPKHLSAYFGLHPVYKQSGDGKWGMHMSKQGRTTPRMLLYMVACSAARADKHIKAIYQKHRQKGLKHRPAIGAVMHKMLRIIYGVLKSGKPYESAIDEQNQLRKTLSVISKGERSDKARRYQPVSLTAPISRRQFQKRSEPLKQPATLPESEAEST